MKPPPSYTKPIVNQTFEASVDFVRAKLDEHHAFLDYYRLKLHILIAKVNESDKVEDASPHMTTLKTF